MLKIFNKKYRFFKKKAQDVQYTIWDLDFKIAKSREVREGVRQDRDRAIEGINQIDNVLPSITIKPEEKESLEKDKATLQENVTRYEAQMKMIDDQINGGVPSEDNPAGIGIMERIKSLTELREMIKQYMRRI